MGNTTEMIDARNRIRKEGIMKRVFCFGVFALVLIAGSTSAFANNKTDKVIKRAEQGDAQAQYELGLKYENGKGIKQNIGLALKWYRMAAENGHVGSMIDLGWFYQNGQYVRKDIQKAIDFYVKAANQENAQAQFNLAILYDEGVDIPEDNEEANKWYLKAAEQGHAIAQLNLGVNYYRGEGVEQDYKKAWNFLNYLRMHSSNMKIRWRARSLLDEIKAEMELSNKFGVYSYPDWEELVNE